LKAYMHNARPVHGSRSVDRTPEEQLLEAELLRIREKSKFRRNPELAALLSLLLPGAGQIYLGQRIAGVLLFLPSVILARLVIPWMVCAVAGAYAAYAAGNRINGDRTGF
jgi:TM2 domain-containing membrane protein YozV